MPELTLESLAARVAELERKLAPARLNIIPATRDWRSVVGISQRTEFSDAMEAEMAAFRESQRSELDAEDGR